MELKILWYVCLHSLGHSGLRRGRSQNGADAEKAIGEMDGSEIDGRAVRVNEAHDKRGGGGGGGGGGGNRW